MFAWISNVEDPKILDITSIIVYPNKLSPPDSLNT
jgi:hypothetical protein